MSTEALSRESCVEVLGPAIALLTAAAIWEERREVVRQEKEQAGALLQHLAHMDEFRSTLPAARSKPLVDAE